MLKHIIHYHFDKIDSTNTWGKQNASSFDPEKITLITADEQSSGRGRFDRCWISPAGRNIYATFCLSIPKFRDDLSSISLVLAITAAQVLQKMGFDIRLKWPNDLLLNEKKIAGVLCETTTLEDKIWLFMGVGININMTPSQLHEIEQPATSLYATTEKLFDKELIVNFLKEQFIFNMNLFLEKGFDPYLDFYRKTICYAFQERLSYIQNSKIQEGNYHSIAADGSINIEMDSGEIKKIFTGEVNSIKRIG